MCSADDHASVSAPDLEAWRSAFDGGHHRQALELAQTLARRASGDARAWQLLGLSLSFCGQQEQGRASLEKAVRLNRNDASIWDALGVVRMRSGEHLEAAQAFRRSLQLVPGNVGVWVNASQNALAGHMAEEALRYARRAVALAPGFAHAHYALGSALHGLGRSAEAVASFEQTLRIEPGLAIAQQGLGNALEGLGRLAEALEAQRRAVALAPGLVAARINLSALHCALGESAAAIREARRALDDEPDSPAAWSNLLYAMVHDGESCAADIDAAHRAFGARMAARHASPAATWDLERDPQRPLRLGFVSGDLRDHPVAHFLRPVWRNLDRTKFRIVAFATSTAVDAVTAELRALSDEWFEVGRDSDEVLAARIRASRIDALFDLSGHTAGNRLAVFARKPAPLQLTWLGYPGSTGLTSVDFRLVDEVVAPPGVHGDAFSERLLYLPYANVFEPPADLPPVVPLPMQANCFLTFGSFNRPSKLSDATLCLWARVMNALPDSRLIVGAVSDASVETKLRQRLIGLGVGGERIRCVGRLARADYLALHGEVDLALDTQPFSSGTTANYGLWMGVPTLTLSGERYVQRLCASRMAAAGLPDFIAASPDEFVAIACHWAARPGALAKLRADLRERMTEQAKRQPTELVRALERGLREVWQAFCVDAGNVP